jgi:4-hydroxybenzoate polyprenyltransferase
MTAKLGSNIKSIVDALVFSNSWISLAALSIYCSTKLVLELPMVFHEGLLVFSATLIGYTILKLKGLNFDGNKSLFDLWMRRNKNSVYALLFIAVLSLLYTLSQVSFPQLVVLSFTVLISLIYMGIERFSLRSFWFFKTQLVAFVWAVFILGIALVDVWMSFQFTGLFIWFSAIFFLILSLTIPFEIRDWEVDNLALKLKTIPMVFGLKGTLILSIVHLVLALLLFLLFSPATITLITLLIVAGIVIYSLNQDSPEWKYTLLIDGLIILVYPLLLLGSMLF